jgi:hypothetical protein
MELSLEIRRVAAKAINKMAEGAILADAIQEAPVEEGTLRGSGRVEPATPQNLTARISFSTPYAARQHEELDWEHPKGGKAKFLEDPLKRHGAQIERIVGKVIKQGLRLSR